MSLLFALDAPLPQLMFSRATPAAMPTNNAPLAAYYSNAEVTLVETVNNTTDVSTTATNNFSAHEFAFQTTSTTNPIALTVTAKAATAGSVNTITLQIYNISTSTWETLATNTTVAANTQFTFNVTQSTNVANYIDARGYCYVRVYQ